MLKTDPLSFLDEEMSPSKLKTQLSTKQPSRQSPQESDPLSFLDQGVEQAPSNNEEPYGPQEAPTFWQKTKKYFKEGKLGSAAAMQIKSGGFSGAPTLTPEQAKKVATEAATIAAVEAAFVPVMGAAAASQIAPGILTSLAHLTRAGTTGAAVTTTSKLVEEGELPSQEELLEHGLTWVAIDAILQGLHLTAASGKVVYDFGEAVSSIAKKEKVPPTEVLNRLWKSTKNYVKSKFGRPLNSPEDIRPEDVKILVDEAKAAEKTGLPPEVEIDVTPQGETKEIGFEEKPQIEFKPVKEQPEQPKQASQAVRSGEQLEANLSQAKNELAELEQMHGKEATHERSALIQQINALELEKHNRAKEAPKDKIEKELSIPEDAVLDKPEHISIGIRGGKGAATVPVAKIGEEGKEYFAHEQIPVTKEEQQLIDAANTWEMAGDHKESSELANQARQMIFDRLNNQNQSIKEGSFEELLKKPTQVPPGQTRPKQPVVGKKQAVARSKILDLFRTAFTDPIRLGKISQKNVAGIHKLWPKVTRLLNDNDIETAAHEIGHNLHTTLYGGNATTPQDQVKTIEAALRPYLAELKPLAHYEPWGMEGFAEFTRLYVTNPEVAQELAPKFYAKFESDLGAQYPEMKNALLQAREYYDTYLQGTPQSRIRAQTSYGSDKGKLESIIDFVKNFGNLDYLKTQFIDDVYPAKRLVAEAFGIPLSEVENLKDERNLYRALRVLKGAVGKGDVFILHETFSAKTLDKINGSLRDILKQLPDEEAYREFNDYLIARRSIEKKVQNIKTGINAGDALIVEQELRPKYGELAKELDKYNDTLLHYAMDAGLLSVDQYVAIKKNNLMYTPFQRVMEPEKGGAASGAGKLQAGKPIKRMKGSTRDIVAPIESIIKNTYSIIINAEKNLAGQVLAKLAATKKNLGGYVERVPTPIKLKAKIQGEQVARELAKRFEREGLNDLIEYDEDGNISLRGDIADAIPEVFLRFGAGQYPAGENIITVYQRGKPTYYETSSDLFEMWTKGIAPYTANLITKILRIPARTLRAGAILNPKFIQKNFIRDTWGSWLFTKYGKSIKEPWKLFMDTLFSPFGMLTTSAGKRDLYVEWLKSGGGMSTMQSLDRDAVTKKLDEIRHGIKPYQVIKWLRQAAEVSEEMNRLAEFGRALEVEGKTRLGREISAFAARDLSIDFAKIGLQTKVLNQIIPFWNATVQGGDKLLRTLGNPKDRKNFIPRILGFIVLPSLMLAWLNRDDERVKEFYEEEKDFNFITFIGDQAIKIPVPFETGVLAHGLTQRMFNYFVKKDPEAFEKFMGSIWDAMSPSFTPAFASPFMETWANKNFFTNARIIPRAQEDLISKYQYKRGGSSTARLLGRAMAYMIGDEETRNKAASPAIIDHFINSWTGGLGRLMINISDASLEAAGLSDKIPGPDQAITERLGLDAFTARYPRASTRSIEKFYDLYADATSKRKSLKYAEKMELETDEDQQSAYKRFDKIYDYKTLQRAYKAMQGCQREVNNIWNDPDLAPEEKKKHIDGLYNQMILFAKYANDEIRH